MSLAAGTPVLAFPEGAAQEIVEHGVNGCSSTMSMRFDRAAQDYERVYAETLARAGGPGGVVSCGGDGGA
jgi:hypothetical protein